MRLVAAEIASSREEKLMSTIVVNGEFNRRKFFKETMRAGRIMAPKVTLIYLPLLFTLLLAELESSLSNQLQPQATANKQINLPIALNTLKSNRQPGGSNAGPSQSSKNQSSSSLAELHPDGAPGDWFMMEGDDLLSQEAKSLQAVFQEGAAGSGGGKAPASSTRRSGSSKKKSNRHHSNSSRTFFDDDSAAAESSNESSSNEISDDGSEEISSQAGSSKEPECASQGRYYCTFKEDYPLKLVTEVTKYYKWPLEKLFRDLHAQIMPKLAQDSTGNLVCDSITRVVRPGWARNTNERWLVVINTENYHQYVTEVVCQYGSNSRCNFIPPCYYSSCQQRYNTQKLLVIDPSNPYRGPFLSEFLFPSCCVCYVPSASDSFQDKYRSSPATIYQRTMQQESANNIYPPQFKPAGLLDKPADVSLLLSAASGSSEVSAGSGRLPQGAPLPSQQQVGAPLSQPSGPNQKELPAANQPAGPGEIRRRAGEAFWQQQQEMMKMSNFPRLGLSDSLDATGQAPTSGNQNADSQQ